MKARPVRFSAGATALILGSATLLPAQEIPGSGRQALPSKPGQVRVLVLEQAAQGLPDQKSDAPVRQAMLIDTRRDRLILHQYRQEAPEGAGGAKEGPAMKEAEIERRIVMRMDFDPPEIYEIWDRERAYRRTRGDLNRVQEERDKQELFELRSARSLPAAERRAFMEENHLREDGRRLVHVDRGAQKEILGYQCQEVTVTENGRRVMRAWITREVEGARSFFHLYRRLGAFSREVLEKVATLEGLPLEAEITVVTAAPAFRISARCLSVKLEEVPDTAFEVPVGYVEKSVEVPPILACPVCGREFERGVAVRLRSSGGDVLFDRAACLRQYRDALDRDLKKTKQAREESTAPGQR